MPAEKKGEKNGTKKQKQVMSTLWHCLNCGAEFYGAKKNPECPDCGENINMERLNKEQMPINKVRAAIGGDPLNTLPVIDLDLTNRTITEAEELDMQNFRRELAAAVREGYLERSKAKLAEEQARRKEAERRLQATSTGEEQQQKELTQQQSQQPISPNPLGASMLIQSISKMPAEERDGFLKRLEENPNLAISLGLMLNPPSFFNPNMSFGSGMYNPYMFYPQPANKEEGTGGGIKDLAEAMTTLLNTAINLKNSSNSGNSELKELNENLKKLLEKDSNSKNSTAETIELVKNIIDLTNEILPRKAETDDDYTPKLRESIEKLEQTLYNERVKNTETREELIKMIHEKLSGMNTRETSLKTELENVTNILDTARELNSRINPPPKEEKETFEEWQKKHILEKEDKEREEKHREKIAELEAKKAKHETVSTLISAALNTMIKQKQKEKEAAIEMKKAAKNNKIKEQEVLSAISKSFSEEEEEDVKDKEEK